MEINLTLPFIVSKTFCSTLLASQGPRSGRIIAIASQAGHVALENHSSYVGVIFPSLAVHDMVLISLVFSALPKLVCSV